MPSSREVIRFCPTNEVTEKDKATFTLFRQRVLTLLENWNDLNDGLKNIPFSFSRSDEGHITVDDFPFNIHRMKGLYLDYRVFISKQEFTNFGRIANQTKKCFRSVPVISEVERFQRSWNENQTALGDWHGYNHVQLTDNYFNGNLFHTDPDKREFFQTIQSSISDPAFHATLWLDIHFRLQLILSLAFIIKPVAVGEMFAQLPIEVAGRNSA